LGSFILELYHGERSKAKEKALVLFVKNAQTAKTLVVAVMGYQQQETCRK